MPVTIQAGSGVGASALLSSTLDVVQMQTVLQKDAVEMAQMEADAVNAAATASSTLTIAAGQQQAAATQTEAETAYVSGITSAIGGGVSLGALGVSMKSDLATTKELDVLGDAQTAIVTRTPTQIAAAGGTRAALATDMPADIRAKCFRGEVGETFSMHVDEFTPEELSGINSAIKSRVKRLSGDRERFTQNMREVSQMSNMFTGAASSFFTGYEKTLAATAQAAQAQAQAVAQVSESSNQQMVSAMQQSQGLVVSIKESIAQELSALANALSALNSRI